MEQRGASKGTQKRLMQAMLAFPIAALIGFGGSVLVRSFWFEVPAKVSPSTLSPRPAGADSDRQGPAQHERQAPTRS